MPFSLGGGPVSLPVRASTMTTLLSFPLCQGVVTFPFGFSNATNSSGGRFLAPSSGLGGSSDVEVAALEVFFLDPAILDVIVAIFGLFFCRLRLVVSLTATDKMALKPSPQASFSEGFFLALFFCRLRLVVSLTATDEMTSKPSPPASFSEDFFLALAYLGMMY
jgi:hypothetical protein